MRRDTTQTVNVDHVNSVKSLYEDDLVSLYGGATQEEHDQTMRDIANNNNSFAITDEHTNKIKKEKKLSQTAEENPELGLDPEK